MLIPLTLSYRQTEIDRPAPLSGLACNHSWEGQHVEFEIEIDKESGKDQGGVMAPRLPVRVPSAFRYSAAVIALL
jgi:hypothetical protein